MSKTISEDAAPLCDFMSQADPKAGFGCFGMKEKDGLEAQEAVWRDRPDQPCARWQNHWHDARASWLNWGYGSAHCVLGVFWGVCLAILQDGEQRDSDAA